MALKREYYPSDTIRLISQSENKVVRDGKRGTTAEIGVDAKYGAHSMGRHLVSSVPGAPKFATTGAGGHKSSNPLLNKAGSGVSYDGFRDRFLVAPENLSSTWIGKGDMAILLCELLNSEMGQYGLGRMDKGAKRVCVHYFNEGKLKNLHGGAQMHESAVTVTPAIETMQSIGIVNPKTGAAIIDPKTNLQKMKMVKHVVAKVVQAKATAKDIIMCNAVFDRFSGGLHLQTFFPSTEAVTSYVEWSMGGANLVAAPDLTGKIVEKVLPFN